MSKKTQPLLSYIFGVIFMALLLLIAFLERNPSSFQYTIFRIVMALAAGGVVATFPGFLEIKLGNWLRGGGALVVFIVVYNTNPASLNVQDLEDSHSDERLELKIDTSFMHEYTYAHTVSRPSNRPPKVYQLATWQRLILNNQSKEPINITELSLVVNGEKTAHDKLESPFFEKIYLNSGVLKFSQNVHYPIRLEPKEFKYLFVSLPTEVPSEIGEIALSILHNNASKMDSMVELFLFGNDPAVEFNKFIPTTIDGREELLVDGGKLSTMVSYSDLALYRQVGFLKEGELYSQVGLGPHDDGFLMMRTSKLFNLISDDLSKRNASISTQVSPVKSAILSAKTSMNEVFSIELKPSSMLIKYTKT
ncbi:hypothetical protein AB6C98_06885 [Vibrio splendidus]